jgi:hypothetical protein
MGLKAAIFWRNTMQNSIARRFLMIGMVLCLAAYVSGCGGPSVDGKYVNSDTGVSMTFSGGKVTLDLGQMGKSTYDYTVSGSTITVKADGGDTVVTINSDGSLTYNGGVLKKAS